ncbi:SAM-dependent methyltransferase [Streptomyces hoynatensis]|uniref:SAM-dependent methyltransferase n=1 Tax=Streptomyces hoynatensis TaxID=1141874 RepID=A0A3A9Z2M1_9ACTN|nr:SAM-dependent methyltransferase [Streptomyces hoynatensis]RKN42465.1 SAM-dependent methyltransferase [Streptomyces hoynatensis]
MTAEGTEQDGTLDLQLDRAHSARIYDYLLGGKTNYALDREAAEAAMRVHPHARTVARVNRAFMHRVTEYLAGRGIRQWLDIGTGIPTSPNLHEVAQSIRPDARIVYADKDRIVLAHAAALMDGRPEGRIAYVHGDATRPETILNAPELTSTLDLDEPVAVSLNALLHFVPDGPAGPREIVGTLLDPLPPGSVLALTHATRDLDPELWDGIVRVYRGTSAPLHLRTREEVAALFDGLDLVSPGLVLAHRWRPKDSGLGSAEPIGDAEVSLWAGVAVKPGA